MGVNGFKVAQTPIEERLFSQRLVTEDGCWLWTGSTTTTGYGRISWRNHLTRVHRIAAHLWLGLDIDETDVLVCHHCDVRTCFNPEHLYLGDPKTNVRDMVDRGRCYPGPEPWERCARGHVKKGPGCLPCRRVWARKTRSQIPASFPTQTCTICWRRVAIVQGVPEDVALERLIKKCKAADGHVSQAEYRPAGGL